MRAPSHQPALPSRDADNQPMMFLTLSQAEEQPAHSVHA
jgi:hypothetical protein